MNSNNLENAQAIISSLSSKGNVKYIKKEQGLIERSKNDDSKIILTEDNRQILLG